MSVLYRYVEIYTSGIGDEYYGAFYPSISLRLEEYEIIKETPCGFWIRTSHGDKFVNMQARKKFACASKEDALASYIARKNKQVKILNGQLKKARLGLALAKNKQKREHETAIK